MQDFNDRARRHAEHVLNAGVHCTTEETTKQALILPLLDILGFSPFDPTRVKAEYAADFPGVKANERVDYALFCQGVPVMFIEAKAWAEKVGNHAPQLSRYFNATPEVAVAAITNGREWRFFTDLDNKNVMDSTPFLTVDFGALDDSQITRLGRFRYDEFQPEALRTLAEESVYLEAFKQVVRRSVLECDLEFVRYVAARSTVQRTLTARFIEVITPIVKQAVAQAMSEMVANSFSAPAVTAVEPQHSAADSEVNPNADQIDPANPRIITTAAERRLLEIVQDVLGPEAGVTAKDTESYYTILYKGKVNRWVVRYYADRKTPHIQIGIPLTDEQRKEITRAGLDITGENIMLPSPNHLGRIPGILFDALAYCQNDENFKREAKPATPSP